MWFIYALLGAVGKSYSGFFRKKVAKSVSGSMYIWLGYSLILLVLTPFMIPQLPAVFGVITALPVVVFGAASLHMIAVQLNLEALKREDLSYTAPLNAFVPVFTLGIAMLFLGENPPRLGLLGIMIVVAGAYVVSIQPERIHWYDPLKRLVTSTGAQLSLAVALCYAINTVLVKVISNDGYNPFVILYVTTLVGWLLLLNVPLSKRGELKAIGQSDKLAIWGGSTSSFAANLFHIMAVASTFTSYAASVRRLDAVISVLLGWRYLKEKNIRLRLLGSLIMTVGTVIMILS